MKNGKQLLELLKIVANEKANEATVLRYKYPEPENQKFYFGRYLAFSEFYTVLCNMEKHIK
jgi:hypothetical protein